MRDGSTCVDARRVDFGDYRGGAGYLGGLRLSSAHSAESGRNEEVPRKSLALSEVELLAARVEQRVVGSVYDSLRPDVHPAAGGHLSVVRYAERGRAAEVLGVVEESDHKAVREDDARRGRMRAEESERMARLHYERLVLRDDFKIFFDEEVLHPVLADLPGLSVGDELVRIERHVEVEVVVDHYLEGFAFDALALIFVDGFAVELSFRTEAVAVDASVLLVFLEELGGELFVVLLGDVAQRVLEREDDFLVVEDLSPVGSPSYSGLKFRHLRKSVRKFQPEFKRFSCRVMHSSLLLP